MLYLRTEIIFNANNLKRTFMKQFRAFSLLVLILLSMNINSHGQVSKPDFAYPVTVSKTATADLAIAEKEKDAHAALNALIRIAVANNMIDPASIQKSIRLVEKTADKFKASDQSGIFDCLLIDMYGSMYSRDRWKYNQRDLPLVPLPADMAEWSGEQFKARIDSLAKASLAKADQLSKLKISDYSDIITANKLTAAYYPTMLDFVCSSYLDIDNEDIKKEVIATGLRFAKKGSPSEILWMSEGKNPYEDDDFYVSAIEKFQGNPAASLLLGEYIAAHANDDTEEFAEDGRNAAAAKWFPLWGVPAIDNYLRRCPTAYMADWLKHLRNTMLRKNAETRMPGMCCPGDSVSVTCDVTNASHVTIALYRLPNGNHRNNDFFKTAEPLMKKEVSFDNSLPFKAQAKVKFVIEKCGYYVAIPLIDGKYNLANSWSQMQCTEVYPISLSGIHEPMSIIVNPKSGCPIEGATVIVANKKGSKPASAVTDALGIAKFAEYPYSANSSDLQVKYKGNQFHFNGVAPYLYQGDEEYAQSTLCILTDRGLYHPGDKVNALVVASEMSAEKNWKKNGRVCAGIKLRASVLNANRKVINDSIEIVTDEYGRAVFNFVLPTDGLTGKYLIKIDNKEFYGVAEFTVSDYRMPDFEIMVTSKEFDSPASGDVTIKGLAKYYSGMPVADAEVAINVSRSSYWRWFSSQYVMSTTAKTDAEGRFSVVLDSVELNPKDSYFYMAEFDATAPSGTAASGRTTFILGKKYVISLNAGENVNGAVLFNPNIEVMDADGKRADIPLLWCLMKGNDTVAQGNVGGEIDLSNIEPGEYAFKVWPADAALASDVSQNFLIYNEKSGIAPTAKLWTCSNFLECSPGKPMELLIASSKPGTVYLFVNKGASLLETRVIEIKPGYKTVSFDMQKLGIDEGQVVMAAVNDFEYTSHTVHFSPKKESQLTIECETFRDNLLPGSLEAWKLRLTDAKGAGMQGALALDMFNKALDAIKAYDPRLSLANVHFGLNLNLVHPYLSAPYSQSAMPMPAIKYEKLAGPHFNFYGYGIGGYIVVNGRMMKMSRGNDILYSVSMSDAEGAEDEYVSEEAFDAGSGDVAQTKELETQEDYRDADVPLAIWAPSLATDADGSICYSFTVPNANTAWKLFALAWTKDLEQGRLVREFVASKPIMVAPNAPRFLRQGDVCSIAASVLNNSDSSCVASSVIEIFNPSNGVVVDRKEFVDSMPAHGAVQISMDVHAGYDSPAIGYRVRVGNGKGFSDGEQAAIPVLSSKAALVETHPFYLNPGETAYATTLPDEPGAKLSLSFCENPTWTIVSALPGLRDMDKVYPNSAAAALFSASVSKGIVAGNPEIREALKKWRENPADSALVSMLEKNADLKIALLNATPWIQAAQSESDRMAALAMILDGKDADKAIVDALEALMKLQRADGGWPWGQWCDKSSVWTTANVLDMLGQLKASGWLPKGSKVDSMVGKAVNYYDAQVRDEDMMYAIVRKYYSEIPISLNGQKVIAKTTASILKEWKKYVDPAYKAMAAEALYLNNYPAKSKDLLKSISEFGVMTPSQGLTFPSVNSLYSYAQILSAYALISPTAPEVDGLRQQLIVRKQGEDWGSSAVTTEVVSAILSCGTKWTVPAQGAKVEAGGREIKANYLEAATGSMRVDLSQCAGQRLEIETSGATPSYGAVYAQFDKKMDEVKAVACEDLSIEKSMSVRQEDGSWQYADGFKVGDRVKVQLTIHSKRDLQYVEIIDERPAAFQPMEQLPGWLWADGLGFYRENRDACTALHVESMRPGTYILTYEMNVGQAGAYSSGVASIQSQYAPEISAHSAGATIVVHHKN